MDGDEVHAAAAVEPLRAQETALQHVHDTSRASRQSCSRCRPTSSPSNATASSAWRVLVTTSIRRRVSRAQASALAGCTRPDAHTG